LALPGWVAIRRQRYARADGSNVYPADAVIERARCTVSLGVRELACRLALDAHSFERAAGNLGAAAQLDLNQETLRSLVEGEGRLLVDSQTHEQLEFEWKAQDCQVTQPQGEQASRIYVSCDGVLIPTVTQREKRLRRAGAIKRRRKLAREGRARPGQLPRLKPGADQGFKEFKIVTIYDQGKEHRAVMARRGDHRQAGRVMRRLAGALGVRQAQEKVAVIDGAEWIAKQMGRNMPYLDAVTLDFYHFSQHVHQARVGVFGEQNQAGLDWAGNLLHQAKHEGYDALWQELVELRAKTRSPIKRAAIDGLMHYVVPRREMIRYPQNQERGWDIGSGPMESMCKALSRRLKGRGMRWNTDNAEAIMALEGLIQGKCWAGWWQKRLASMN
jgi:hypothetical protein